MTTSTSELLTTVEQLFSSLYDIEFSVKELKNSEIKPHSLIVCYGKEDDVDSACVFDLAIANSLSAALPRIHKNIATEATAAGEFPDNLRTVFDEIANIGTVMMRRDRKQRIELKQILGPDCTLPEEIQSLLNLPGISFELQVGDYDPGNLTLIFK